MLDGLDDDDESPGESGVRNQPGELGSNGGSYRSDTAGSPENGVGPKAQVSGRTEGFAGMPADPRAERVRSGWDSGSCLVTEARGEQPSGPR